jgi:proton-coupled amino acid transporter
MGDAFKNGGLIAAPILTVILAILYVHSQHMLLSCSQKVRERFMIQRRLSYPETVELCLEAGSEPVRKWSKFGRQICNAFICVMQTGFCCIYFLFIGKNIRQILENYGFSVDLDDVMLASLVPILLISLIVDLKYLVPFSLVADICMIRGIAITFYYSAADLPALSERNYIGQLHQLPLFFGTVVYAFEGISLILPLQNSMKNPGNFSRACGVLNLGMIIVTAIFVCIGFFGYLQYGEGVKGSLSLNLPNDQK